MPIRPFLFTILVALCLCGLMIPAHADISSTDLYEINNATPGLSKVAAGLAGTGLGNMLRGSRMSQVYGVGDALGNLDSNSPNTTVAGYRLVVWQIPLNNFSFPLGSGITGQRMTIVKGNTGTTPGKITPVTKTGFTDITLTNQGDGVTLEWHDSTGWIPVGVFGSSTVGKVNP